MKLQLSLLLLFAALAVAQEQPNPKTLLPDAVIEAIADEVSGSLAHQHTIELGGYNRNRPSAEYLGTYWESEYVEKMAKEYGFSEAKIERFPLERRQWDAEYGELWMVEPEPKLLISHRDIAAALAPGSGTAEVTAELVYCGRGESEADFEGKEVKAKMVLVSGSISSAYRVAVNQLGAAGVISFNNPTGKPLDRVDQISWQSVPAGAGDSVSGFGFNLSHRLGIELLTLLEKRQRVVLHAKIKTDYYEVDEEVPTAIIPGDGSTPQEIVLMGHLFEGISKQGAGDDMSGCAVVLEAGRALIKLMAEGKIPRNKRTIRFLWVPEISGTARYLARYPEEAENLVCAISVDMIGYDQTRHRNSLHLYTNPWPMASFLDDVCQDFFEYLGDTNREKVHNRRIAYAFRKPIFDPNGSRDPFFYQIEKYYGSSDHAVFNNPAAKIPAVLFNAWPDIAYHSSEDRPYNLDPTQLKRGAFLVAATGLVLANVDNASALRIAALAMGYGAERLGRDLMEALDMVSRAGKDGLAFAYKEAGNLVHQAYLRESRRIASLKRFDNLEASTLAYIDETGKNLLAAERVDRQKLAAHYHACCREVGIPAVEPKLTPEEIAASKLYPKMLPPEEGNLFARFFGGASRALTGFRSESARHYADGSHSVLEIANAVNAEHGDVTVAQVKKFFEDLVEAKRAEMSTRGRN
jgi:hypothetical protein